MYVKSMALDFDVYEVHGIQKGSFEHRLCVDKN